VLPSFDKISQVRRFGDLWKLPWLQLHNDLEVVIIGYSMREDDFHSRAFLYPQLVAGSRRGDLAVKVIDLADDRSTRADIENRYAGVENAKFFFSGFGEEALRFIDGR
jgi:hypothetical protein